MIDFLKLLLLGARLRVGYQEFRAEQVQLRAGSVLESRCEWRQGRRVVEILEERKGTFLFEPLF